MHNMHQYCTLLFLVVAHVAAQESEEIDIDFRKEHYIGLDPQYDTEEFISMILEVYQLDIKKIYDIRRTKILVVVGDETNVLALMDADLPAVKYVSRNELMYAVGLGGECCPADQSSGLWGLDRIDQRAILSYTDPAYNDAKYTYGLPYNDGEDVDVYIGDTGIDINHPTFQGRARWGYSAPATPGTADGHGHGTHVAGTVGGADYGVAKKANLVAVKVLNDGGGGTVSSLLDGLTWIRGQHVQGTSRSVVNLSLAGTGTVTVVEDLIGEMFLEGISFALAAANSNRDACNYWPANTPEAITVAASDVRDNTAWFTNYGPCVDIHAPGVDILSALPNNNSARWDGTSMASPHVAGVMARYISLFTKCSKKPPTAQKVTDWILAKATDNAISFLPGHDTSPNKLLYTPCGI